MTIEPLQQQEVAALRQRIAELESMLTLVERSDPDQNSETDLRQLFAAVTDVVLVMDIDGRYVEIAPTNPSGLYRPSAEMLGKTLHEIFPTEQADFFLYYIHQTLATQTPQRFEYCLPIGDRTFWFDACTSALSQERVILVARDITERKQMEAVLQQTNEELEHRVQERTLALQQTVEQLQQEVQDRRAAEAALQESAAWHRTILDTIPDQLFRYDSNGTYQAVVTSSDGHWLPGVHTRKGQSIAAVLPATVACQVLAAIQLTLTTGQVQLIEYQLDVDGEPHDYEARLIRCGPDDVLSIVRDITERKRYERDRKAAELALQESETKNRALLEAIPDMMFHYDRQGIHLGFVPSREWRTVLDPEAFLGKSVTEVLPSSVAQQLIATIEQTLETNEIQLIEYQLELEGELHDYEARLVKCDVDEVLTIVRDITDRKRYERDRRQAEAQLRQQATELQAALQEVQRTQAHLVQSEKMSSLGQLVAGVAHEINNPVNFIFGNLTYATEYTTDLLKLVDLYQHHYPTPHPTIQTTAEAIDLEFLMADLPKLLTSMRVGAERIQAIVASLRNFSRMDEAEFKAVDIHAGIDSTLMILQNRLKPNGDRTGIEVTKHYGSLPLVECYAGQLNQVFMNILSNAVDALDERDNERSLEERQQQPSRIEIHTQLSNTQQVVIRIVDNGPGIPEDTRQRLFDPFFTTKPVGKGTGMGLSISYQIVTERHGGTLECHSTPGLGSEFVIQIPLEQPNRPKD